MEKIKINSPFCTTAEKIAIGNFDQEYVSYIEVQKVKDGFDPERPHEFVIESEFVEDQRIPIEDELNSHRNRVGLKNMLKGIVSSRQMSDLIEKTQSNGLFVDGTHMPNSDLEMEKLVGNINKIWDSIPDDLKGDLSKEEFMASITADRIKKYVSSVSDSSDERGSE